MFRNKLWAVALGAVLFASCEEIGPAINLEDVAAEAGDTTYVVSPVPGAQARNVLLEEFTGVKCPNCPAGHAIVQGLKEDLGDRLIAIGLYMENNNLTAPIDKDGKLTKDDFRTPISNEVNSGIYDSEASALPSGGVDRVPSGSLLLLDRNKWAGAVNVRKDVPTKANLELTSTYNEADQTLKVKVTVTFTSPVSKKAFVTVGVIQDSILDYQETTTTILENYPHVHVLRGLISPNGINGLELEMQGAYEAGRVFEKTITVKLLEKLKANSPLLNTTYIKPEHCSVFAFIHHNGADKEILQAAEVHMK